MRRASCSELAHPFEIIADVAMTVKPNARFVSGVCRPLIVFGSAESHQRVDRASEGSRVTGGYEHAGFAICNLLGNSTDGRLDTGS